MSSLGTKVNKSRSSASGKVQAAKATKAKKAASKKPQRPGKITAAPKSKKAAPAKSKKQATAAKKPSAQMSKKAPPKKKGAAAPSAKASNRPAARPPARGQAGLKSAQVASKAAQQQQSAKKAATPGALAAVKAFEQALKAFNRHDFAAAKSAFDEVLKKFSDQAEVVARARTYLAICEQRLARAPSVPRSPDALYDQGVFELNKGNIREAIELFEKALKAEPRADHIIYSLAAAHARLNDVPKAMDALRRAISLRSVHRSHARRDLDFASLRSNEDFQQLTGFGFDFIEE